jgi:hypothetical protein
MNGVLPFTLQQHHQEWSMREPSLVVPKESDDQGRLQSQRTGMVMHKHKGGRERSQPDEKEKEKGVEFLQLGQVPSKQRAIPKRMNVVCFQ